MFIKAILFFTF